MEQSSLPRQPVAPKLPDTFAFSQSSLQAYVDCPRRFWLGYVEQLPWPAIEAAPVQEHEQLVRLGSAFHRLVQRAEVGIEADRLAAGLDTQLAGWFAAYQRHRPADLPTQSVEVEHILTIPFPTRLPQAPSSQFRLAAKYDLIAAEKAGRVVIIDWKTTRKRTDPATLRRRLQSVVYPYVLVEASVGLPWGPVEPEQVEMRYWFTAAPGQPVILRYDQAQHAANHEKLHHLVSDILSSEGENNFPKVSDTDINRKRFCNFCVYRSRCNRGIAAGHLDEIGDPEDFFAVDIKAALEFTLDDVVELAF
jgi:hypothetical protein